MAKPRGLGRGLDALLGGDVPASVSDRLVDMSPASLQPGRYQPRSQIDESAIEALADSIRSQGLIQPILARPIGPDRYEIIAGERRWRAAQKAGLKEVPVLVRDVPDEAALAMALIENIQREDLNAIEEAAGIQRLIDDFGMTHQSAADAVGRSRSAVSNILRLLQLPAAIRQMLVDRRLEMGHARALLGLPTTHQLELANRIATKGLSVREAETLAARCAAAGDLPAGASRARRDRDVIKLEEELSERLGTAVHVTTGRKGKGKLTIEYGSLDKLEEVLSRLRTP
jgi:ParB family chromosome partitioning protein